LDSGLDNIEGSRDDEGGRSTGDGGDKVLEPAGLVVVLKLEEIFLGESRTSKELIRVNAFVSKSLIIFTHILLPVRYNGTSMRLGLKRRAYSERAGCVSSSSPSPASVQAEALVGNNLQDSTATESLGVGLALDLEDIEGQQDDFTDTNQTIIS
jgi:hypothetical protein